MIETTRMIIGFLRRVSFAAACLAVAAAIMFASAPHAQAQTLIDPSQSIGPVPGFAGTGLDGIYYDYNVGSNPLGTFTAPNICFPDCNGNSFSDGSGGFLAFTNGHVDNVNFLIPTGNLPTTWGNSALSIVGYIAIANPGTYSFSLGSDDNSHLTVGGQNFLNIPGCCQTVTGPATFSAAGLYPIAVQFMEIGGGSYLNVTEKDGNTGACILGCSNAGGLVDSGLFYSQGQLQGAPAPTIGGGLPSMALLALLAAGASVWQYQRRRI
jgi:hypothetical protein